MVDSLVSWVAPESAGRIGEYHKRHNETRLLKVLCVDDFALARMARFRSALWG